MANIDISSKLSHEPQTITIAEGKTYEVDCGAETMLKAQDLFKKDDSLDGLFKAIELLLGKEALEEIIYIYFFMKGQRNAANHADGKKNGFEYADICEVLTYLVKKLKMQNEKRKG